jgi:type IV pilus assembly protein PilO
VNTKTKQWSALAALAAVAILAGGWFLLVSPKRSNAADLRSQAAAKESANAQLVTELSALKAQAKDLPAQQAKLAAVAAKIPANSAMPALIRNLDSAASDVGVELVSITPTPAAPLTASAPTAATAAKPAGVAKATTAAGTTTAAARSTAAAAGSLEQIGVTLNVVGSYFQVAEFLDRLENLPRAFKVGGVNLAPGNNPVKPGASQPSTDSGKMLTATITGQVFQSAAAASTPTITK